MVERRLWTPSKNDNHPLVPWVIIWRRDGCPLSVMNMKGLLELEMLDKLDVCGTEDDFGLLPLSSKASKAVEYRMHIHPLIQPHDFRDLASSAKDLQWTFRATIRDNWDALLLAF
ncbi:hypothetical protein FisN_10Lu395 [Fistulifera solaris]|uniref:Uncharacterized protein n=1 Tax=Fistulifera solaris TaxID=1519565 RepID=A0A1Z5JV77_FISSO|nr:hypothetical protein FisN_10Lu395 [Fistulifera solaris]|eukprot:GAX17678.1 hypothetical protein FisN_10Lu395 [Fistulifera solaris]